MVWAEAHGGVIGAGGGMPWHVPEDLAHFKTVTLGSPVVMGRRTWESLPDRFRPLPGRRNIVVTRNERWADAGADRAGSLEEALALVSDAEWVWIIGGGALFREGMALADRLEVTDLDLDVAGDTFAPSTDGWTAVSAGDWRTSVSGIRYRFLGLERSAAARH
jgi:dihydrofolate reductase